jgi:hypothetical protein
MDTIVILAATTDLTAMLGKVVFLFQCISIVISLGAFTAAALNVIGGRMEHVPHMLLGAFLSGGAWVILTVLFKMGGFDTVITPQTF